jgi:hypothetical protein
VERKRLMTIALVALAVAVFLARRLRAPQGDLAQTSPEPAQPPGEPAASPSVSPAGTVEGYCVKERKRVQVKDAEQVVTKNGRPAVRGVCPDCGSAIFRFGTLP